MKLKKKSNVTFILSTIIILLLTFFLYLTIFTGIWKDTVKTGDDMICRAFIAGKSSYPAKIGEFFYQLNGRCKLDKNVKIDLSERNQSFQDIGDSMARCWFRYGEGKYDFLSNFGTEGKWCFLCGSLKYEDNSEVVPFNQYVDWTRNNKVNDNTTYFAYTNILYSDISGEENSNLRQDFDNLLSDEDFGDASMKPIINLIGGKLDEVDNLRLKTFNAEDEKVYVVYRYDRLDKKLNYSEVTKDVYIGIGAGIAASIIAEGLTEAFLGGAIGGGACAATGIGIVVSPICIAGGAIGGFISGTVKSIYKGVSSTRKVIKAIRILKRATEAIKSSKIAVRTIETIDVIKNAKNAQKAIEVTEDLILYGEKAHLEIVFEGLEDGNEFREPLQNVIKMMEDLKINKYDDIADTKNFNLEKIDNVIDLYIKNKERLENAKKTGEITKRLEKINQNLGSMGKAQLKLEEIASLEIEVGSILNRLKKGETITDVDKVKFTDYMRVITILAAGTTGGAVGGYIGVNYNEDYNQYVDILTREEYYKYCGTDPDLIN